MEANSLGDVLRRSARRAPDKVALLAPGKQDFSEITYGELETTVRRYAGVLRSQGIIRGDHAVILSENCVEWTFAFWACQSLGIVVVPIFPTLPADQASYIVRDAESKLVIAGGDDQLAKASGIDGVTMILLKGARSLAELAASSGEGLSPEEWNHQIDETKPEDLSTIIYTSGTTGQPKGAMLQHRAFMHVCEYAQRDIPLYDTDTFLTFLPMSHVYELVAGQCLPIHLGATIGYAKSLQSLPGDMLKVRPTILLCVPRFLQAFCERVEDTIAKGPPVSRKLFELAMSQSLKRSRGKFAPLASLLDKIVLSRIRARLGGRMRFFVSGGAALPAHVAEFFFGAGLCVLQGYGLTETTGGTCINHPDRNKYWTVGESLGMDLKIANDGEILIKGPAVMTGYYKLPDETAAALDSDGWFHTGDIGEFEGSSLKITDRKKDIIVLGNGKNVAPQPIENKLKASPLILEALVLGDGMDHCVALIVPNFEALRGSLKLSDDAVLSENPEARGLIKKEVDRTNKSLANFEMIKKHAILDSPFTLESGELTPTQKVKRKVVKEKYAALIAALS